MYATVLGAAIGSFLNVVIYRLHSGRTLAGRSACLSCARCLPWYDLLPVISFIAMRGKCRACRGRISWQYPLVESLTAVVFFLSVLVFLQSPIGLLTVLQLSFRLVVWPILIVILFYDLRHKIIPDGFVFCFVGLALLYQVVAALVIGFDRFFISDILSGPLLFMFFFLLWFFSKGRWMGFGDAKLALGMGFWLGLGGGISATVFGFWSGALVGILLIAFFSLHARRTRLNGGLKKVTMKSEVPFAPYLIAGVFAVEFLHFSLFNLVWLLNI